MNLQIFDTVARFSATDSHPSKIQHSDRLGFTIKI